MDFGGVTQGTIDPDVIKSGIGIQFVFAEVAQIFGVGAEREQQQKSEQEDLHESTSVVGEKVSNGSG